ncbi:hypothetical protein [Adhaeribacter radiodurans]|uniref:RiboL-PSP-HEPN domain-containing protein n=1 Tax=Adhaeribacter radiodurans TaxID=2745197 RepID=A0A7L7L1I7_9BACT|nr:hypothetical protein [Adhaeribacter radiodurans]QMU26653.1 hypothetical protein HUW48_00785 [Adhaeribacter radiodurans]
MPSAKQNFLDRIIHIRKSLEIDTLNDRTSNHIEHNNIAKILRNGIAVVGFVALEDFIKSRTGEILSEIGLTTVPFNSLPEKIRLSTTLETLNSLNRVSKLETSINDRIQLIQNEARKIASTVNPTFELTQYAFGYKNSNISADEIKEILSSFLIKDPWRKMTIVSSRLGLTSLPLDNSFKNAALRRHQAAHLGSSSIPINDLKQYVKEAFGIVISFDCLISKCLLEIRNHNVSYLNNSFSINDSHIKLGFINFDSNKWKYKKENQSRATRTNIDLNILKSEVISLASRSGECLVLYDKDNNVVDWYL